MKNSFARKGEAKPFVQVVQLQTSQFDAIRAVVEDYERATDGKRTVRRSVICRDRDDPTNHSIIVFFDSYEDAMVNSALPETDALAKRMADLVDAPPIFHNLDVIEDRA